MKNFIKISTYFLAVLLIAGSVGHILNPKMSDGFIPDFLPKSIVHGLTAVVELSLGIALLFKKYRKQAALFSVMLLSTFLVLHVIDVFRDSPVLGSQTAAIIRIPFQFLFMYMSWVVYQAKW
ncbi:MAG: hypothetical protein U5L45_13945 [Saprospiraceae bacterium]|nr:hypothetical protein [Saprospiraceae bacterium]